MKTASTSPACAICGSYRVRKLFLVGEYQITRCHECAGGFVLPMPSPSDMSAIYSDQYGDGYLDGPMHGQQFAEDRFRTVMGLLDGLDLPVPRLPQRRALDVGCGSGHFLALLRGAGWETRGLELSPRLVGYAVKELGLDVYRADFLAADLPDESFHFISMFHVIEHFSDPRAAVKKAVRLLVPGGLLFIETPNWESIGALVRGKHWSHFIPPEHLVYFGPRAIRSLGKSCGLVSVACRTTTPAVLTSLGSLTGPARSVGVAAYRLASGLGRGPALQYLGSKP